MSTLKVTNIQSNAAGFNDVVSFQNSGGTVNGTLCRAFVNFNGTGTVAIRASFNVSSITDNGTGDYTMNFTSALANANYAVTVSNRREESVTLSTATRNIIGVLTYTTSSFRVIAHEAANNTFQDQLYLNISVFR